MAASQGAGVGGSAAEAGSVGALGTLTATNLGALGTQMRGTQAMDRSQERQFGFQQTSMAAQQRAQLWEGVGQLSSSVFQGAGGFPSLSDNFRGTGNPSDIEVVDLRG